MSKPASEPYWMGIDLGVGSVGVCCVDLEPNSSGELRPASIRHMCVHTFEAGVEGQIEQGRDKSKAEPRRVARLSRRQIWRRAARRRKLLHILQRGGLLPEGSASSPEQIHEYLLNLDRSLRSRRLSPEDRVGAHVLPYRLRALALDERLEPHELGRALYHLGQRRGFLSNRKQPASKEEGEMKQEISGLEQELAASNSTLGQFFSRIDPTQERIRRRHTSRAMYEKEFEAIWKAQAAHHAQLMTPELKKQVRGAIFFQRPLKSQSQLIGTCDLIPGRKRAPMAIRIAQRFRILQTANHLRIELPDLKERGLTEEERRKVVSMLMQRANLELKTLAGARGLNLPTGASFTLDRGGEDKLPGHRTDAEMRKAFGKAWDDKPEAEKDAIVETWLAFEDEKAIARWAQKKLNLDEVSAAKLVNARLEQTRAAHCRVGLSRLVQRMEDGTAYSTARKELFPEQFTAGEALDWLPPLLGGTSKVIESSCTRPKTWSGARSIRNPAVCRTLTEMRKVVNALIARYGKPEAIRIEMARDLKHSREQRQRITKANRDRQKLRDRAREAILTWCPGVEPGGLQIEKVLLAEECGWACPYTGRHISMDTLLGRNPQFDIEHIWPMSRSLDNSFANKTLCDLSENRNRKCNRTPWEAYASDEQRWHEIITRVRSFRGEHVRNKLARFLAEEIPADFTQRQLQDTRYTTRLAREYLGVLYGGFCDAQGRQRVYALAGGITAHVRNVLGLNGILGRDGFKSRADHRHHGVDALAIALAGPRIVQQLEAASADDSRRGSRLFAPIPDPWPGFLDEARNVVEKVKVSRRISRRIRGCLHDQTNYGKAIPANGTEERHFRKELQKLTEKEITGDSIVDPVIRKLVQERYASLKAAAQDKGPGKLFESRESHPSIKTRDGCLIPIHKVRMRSRQKVWAIGKESRQRFVVPGANHHTAIVAVLDEQGREVRWEDHPVTRLEVHQRLCAGQPIIQQAWGPGRRLKMWLMIDDYLLIHRESGEQLCRVASLSQGDIELRAHADARTQDEVKTAKQRIRIKSMSAFMAVCPRKVTVDYGGVVRPIGL